MFPVTFLDVISHPAEHLLPFLFETALVLFGFCCILYLDEQELSAFLWFCGPWLQDLLRLRLFFWHWKISVLPWSIRLLNLMSILLSGRNSFAGTRRALGWSTCAMREKNTTSYKWHNITLSRTLMIFVYLATRHWYFHLLDNYIWYTESEEAVRLNGSSLSNADEEVQIYQLQQVTFTLQPYTSYTR